MVTGCHLTSLSPFPKGKAGGIATFRPAPSFVAERCVPRESLLCAARTCASSHTTPRCYSDGNKSPEEPTLSSLRGFSLLCKDVDDCLEHNQQDSSPGEVHLAEERRQIPQPERSEGCKRGLLIHFAWSFAALHDGVLIPVNFTRL